MKQGALENLSQSGSIHTTKGLKNNLSSKTIKGELNSFELDVPRDNTGILEPLIIKKNQTHMSY